MPESDQNSLRFASQPKGNDPLEVDIRTKLDQLYHSEASLKVIDLLRRKQSDFFASAFNKIDHPDQIYIEYRSLLKELAVATNPKITFGSEQLDELRNNSYILITNHLGIPKLARIPNLDRKFPVNLDEFEPFPCRASNLLLIADHLNAALLETAVELPEPLLRIQEACGVLTIPTSGSGRTTVLVDKVRSVVKSGRKSLIVMYPEGGTSGKRNAGGPYDLDKFHRGAFVASMATGTNIIPVCQYFKPDGHFELQILDLVKSADINSGNINDIMGAVRLQMQERLHSLQ